MGDRRDIPWTTLFIEGVAIVVSILLAFAIDAWWDQRKERAEEREILIGLETEFADLRERLDFWAGFNHDGAELIAAALSSPVSDMDNPEFEKLFVYSWLVNVLDQGGPLDALLASGRLEKVQDQEIRARLAKWPDWLEDIHTNDLSIRDYAWREILPYLNRHGIPDIVCPEGVFWCAEPGPAPEHYVAVANDPVYRAMLTGRRAMMWNSADDHQSARDQADEILVLIRARLAALGQGDTL